MQYIVEIDSRKHEKLSSKQKNYRQIYINLFYICIQIKKAQQFSNPLYVQDQSQKQPEQIKELKQKQSLGSKFTGIFKRNKEPVISKPYNVKHLMHVSFDPKSGFNGLPPQWQIIMTHAGLNEAELIQNAQEVNQIMEVFDDVKMDFVKSPEKVDEKVLEDQIQQQLVQDQETEVFQEAEKSEEIIMEQVQQLEIIEFQQMPNEQQIVELQIQVDSFIINARNPLNFFLRPQIVARGRTANVFKAETKSQGIPVALKVISLESVRRGEVRGDPEVLLRNEIAVLATSQRCPESLRLIDVFKSNVRKEYWIVMEYVKYPLTSLLKRIGGFGDNPPAIAYVVKQVLLQLQQLHKNYQIFRDLQSKNIHFTEQFEVKLIDYGQACQLTEQLPSRSSVVGGYQWLPPELITEKSISQSADIWSLGIVLIELVEGLPPFSNLPNLRTVFNLVTKQPPVFKQKCSPVLSEFLAKCCVKDPEARSSCEDLLSSPFIQLASKEAFQAVAKQYI